MEVAYSRLQGKPVADEMIDVRSRSVKANMKYRLTI